MINLEKISGLPIELTDDFHLKFNSPLVDVKPSVRTLSDMKAVLLDPNAHSSREEMYYMYRDIHLPQDEKVLRENNLRYDLTILPPGMIGEEFNKTVGHYHPKNSAGVEFPELYEVLQGEALFLLQNAKEAVAIKASAGQKIAYPPGYAHIIVNIGKEALVTANWVSDKFESEYEPIKQKQGMAHYVIADKQNGFKLVSNKNYMPELPVRRTIAAEDPGFGIGAGPMYLSGVATPKNLAFLNTPQDYQIVLK